MGVGPAIQMLDAEEKSRLAGAKVEPGPSKRPLCRKKTRRSGRCGERKKIEKERDETEKKRGTGIGAQSWTVVTMSTNERRSIKSRAEKGRDRLRTCALKGEDSEVSAHPIRSSSDLRPAARADGSFCQANEFLWGPPPFLLCVCACVCVCPSLFLCVFRIPSQWFTLATQACRPDTRRSMLCAPADCVAAVARKTH